MNNSISFRRTVLYARKHYVENARYYGYGLLAILILLSVFAWFYGSWRSDPGEFRVTACFTMLGFMYYVTRLSCRNLYKRLPMVRSYTLPVTAAEKYLFIWFNTTVIATLLFSLVLWPVTAEADIPDGNIIRIMIYPTWLTIFTVQAGLLLACCWGKEYPMKIFLLLAGAFILFFIIYYWVLMPSDGLFVRIPFSEFTVNIHSDTARLSFPLRKQLPEYGAYTMIFGYWTLVSWVTGYFKLREKTLK